MKPTRRAAQKRRADMNMGSSRASWSGTGATKRSSLLTGSLLKVHTGSNKLGEIFSSVMSVKLVDALDWGEREPLSRRDEDEEDVAIVKKLGGFSPRGHDEALNMKGKLTMFTPGCFLFTRFMGRQKVSIPSANEGNRIIMGTLIQLLDRRHVGRARHANPTGLMRYSPPWLAGEKGNLGGVALSRARSSVFSGCPLSLLINKYTKCLTAPVGTLLGRVPMRAG